MLRGILAPLLLLSIIHRLSLSTANTWSLVPNCTDSRPTPWTHNFQLQQCIEITLARSRKQIETLLKNPYHNSTLAAITILLSGDVHSNPGPDASICPCGFCDQPVTWSCKGICCDSCNIWFHHSCVDVGSAEYDTISRPTIAWICPRCDSINCDSFTFRSYEIETSNHYAPLQNSSHMDSISSLDPFSPQQASTPKYSNKSSTINSTTSYHRPPSQQKGHSNSASSSIFTLPKKTNLRIMNVNCQSIMAKKQELAAAIKYAKPDIVCGTESWLRGIQPGKNPDPDHIKSAEVFPDDYNVFRNDRTTHGGGVFIMAHNSLTSEETTEYSTNCELLWIKLKLKNLKDLYIGAFYMPKRNTQDIDELQKSLNKLTSNGKRQREIILAGDFNCPDINWSTHTAHSQGKDNTIQQSLVDITSSFLMTQVHLSPTRGNNILDLTFTSNPSLVKASTCIPGISDHNIVITDFDTKPQINPQRPRKCYKFGKADWNQMASDLDTMEEDVTEQHKAGNDAETLWNTFKTHLFNTINKNIPSYTFKPSTSLPWINAPLKRMLKRKKRLFKKAISTNDWSPYRHFQKHCRRELRKAEWQYINATIQEGLDRNNSKPFWRYIKARKQDNTGVAPLKENGQLHSDSQTKANILLNQFKSVFTRPSTNQLPHPTQTRPAIPPITITVPGVIKLLQQLKPNKAPGPDSIPNIVLKTLANNIAPSLTLIFQTSLNSGQLPKDWLTANVACAYKKGDRHLASNYRPISLTSVPCKLLEHIIFRHIMQHLETNKILTHLNHGFRSGFSTETQLITTTHDILTSFDKGTQLDMAILDFSKAFDTVPHNKLLHKLRSYGIDGPIHDWLRCFLTNRSMQVVVEGVSSEPTPVVSGVPQGTVLGPLLFLCHINDLPDTVTSQVRLFADDCLLYREINDFKDHQTLQNDLKCLEGWADKWGMRFNATKCYTMSLGKKQTSPFMYSLDNTILQTVTNTPYLGIHFSNDMKWSHHINTTTKKANSTLGFLRRNMRHSPTPCKRNAYLALVRPLLEYGATIWDPYQQQDISKIERIQRSATRFISRNYHTNTPGFITDLQKKYNLPTLQQRREELRLTFFYKTVEGQIPAMPPDKFLTPQKPCRKIVPRLSQDYITQNPVQNYARNNDRCYKVPHCNTPQYKHSFIPRTTIAWNNLDNSTVNSPSVESFKLALAQARSQ